MIGIKLMKHHYPKHNYSNLNLDDNTDKDYDHAKKLGKNLE